MIRRLYWFLILLILTVFQIHIAHACRFNVRETGFVDLGNERYFLVGYVNDQTPAGIIIDFVDVTEEMLSGSNIVFELINVDEQKSHPAVQYLSNKGQQSVPTTVLISPDGQSLVFPVDESDKTFKKSLKDVLNRILYSPIRERLQNQVIDKYGVILVIEGRNKEENVLAQQAVQEALKKVTKKMDLMPKAIKNPPTLRVLKYHERSQDPILLWTFGLDTDKLDKPHAAIFYGRARWLGPLFRGEEISKNNLSEILFVIGADCECGLDKNWLRGTMLPMKWDKKTQAQITQNLGFDSENPMIKIEVNRIMRTEHYDPGEGVGYPGIHVEPDSANTPRQGISYDDDDKVIKEVNFTQADSSHLQGRSILTKSVFFTAGILALLLIAGFIVVFRRQR